MTPTWWPDSRPPGASIMREMEAFRPRGPRGRGSPSRKWSKQRAAEPSGGCYILGEDRAITEPDSNHTRQSLKACEFVVLQENLSIGDGQPAPTYYCPAAHSLKTAARSRIQCGACSSSEKQSSPLVTPGPIGRSSARSQMVCPPRSVARRAVRTPAGSIAHRTGHARNCRSHTVICWRQPSAAGAA